MIDLEQLAEDIHNEADELDSIVQHLKRVEMTTRKSFTNIVDNLKYYSDLVYSAFEDDTLDDTLQNIDNIKDLNSKLLMILKDTLNFNDLVYYCSKYNIDRELFW